MWRQKDWESKKLIVTKIAKWIKTTSTKILFLSKIIEFVKFRKNIWQNPLIAFCKGSFFIIALRGLSLVVTFFVWLIVFWEMWHNYRFIWRLENLHITSILNLIYFYIFRSRIPVGSIYFFTGKIVNGNKVWKIFLAYIVAFYCKNVGEWKKVKFCHWQKISDAITD